MTQHMKNKEKEKEKEKDDVGEVDDGIENTRDEVADEVAGGSAGREIEASPGNLISIRKKIRNYIVDKNVESIKRSGIPLDLACLFIKIIHFRMPFDIMLMANFSSPFISLCLWITVMIIFSCFLLLDGCVLSVIEYKLTGNSLNVMDIFLWLFGCEINHNNRYNATIIAAIIYLISFFILVLNKGGFNHIHTNKVIYYITFSYLTNFISSDCVEL